MTTEGIVQLISNSVDKNAVLGVDLESSPHTVQIRPSFLQGVCQLLKDHKQCYFDLLECITALHNVEETTIEVFYNLYSIPHESKLMLAVSVPIEKDTVSLPSVDSVSRVWKAAEWHEREAYDLVGIVFNNHPDLRRILLPADWERYPLRKDYQLQEYYRGIKVEY